MDQAAGKLPVILANLICTDGGISRTITAAAWSTPNILRLTVPALNPAPDPNVYIRWPQLNLALSNAGGTIPAAAFNINATDNR